MANSAIQCTSYGVATESQRGVVNGTDARNLVFGGSALSFRNRVLNGAMMVDQRNAGAKVTGSVFGMDRFAINQTVPGKLGLQQISNDAPAGFTYSAAITVEASYSVTASDFYGLIQCIEGYNISDLNWGTANAATVTLSFWAKASTAGTYGGALFNETGTRRTYAFTYTIAAANTWEYKTVTIPGCTDGTWNYTNVAGVYVNFALGIGSNVQTTAGSWQSGAFRGPSGVTQLVGLANGQSLKITGIQFEKSSVATPFENRPYGVELALCQRYCYTWVGTDGIDSGSNYTKLGLGFARTSTLCDVIVYLPTMRTAPTFLDSGAATVNLLGSSTYGGAVAAIAATNVALEVGAISSRICVVRYTVASGLIPGQCYIIEQNNAQTKKQLFFAEL